MAVPELYNSGLPAADVGELVDLYAAAAARFRQMVLHPPGGTRAGRAFRVARAAQLTIQIDRLLVQLRSGTAAWVGANLPQALAAGVALAERQAADAGVRVPGSPLNGGFALVDQGTVRQFARDVVTPLAAAADRAGGRARRLLRQTAQLDLGEADINRILAGGVIAGEPAQTVRNLRDEFRRVGANTVSVIDRNGDPINYDAGYYAAMVARTKTRQATVQARHDRLEGLGLDLVAVVGRVSVNFCTAYLGQVFSLSGRSDKYPALSELPGGGPPFHPFCSKSTRPFVAELASDRQLEQADGVADSDSLLNVTPADAQRRFKDLQVLTQVKASYGTTAARLFGPASKGR